MNYALPKREHSARLADQLRPARARLLRRASIAHRQAILELGAGWGYVTAELLRRSTAEVTAVDTDPCVLAMDSSLVRSQRRAGDPATLDALDARRLHCVQASAEQLPFDDRRFDLVFAQCTFLWIAQPRRAVSEAVRVLTPGGALAVLEPDFGGLMEHPPESAIQSIWIPALRRTGADPLIGRKLPGWFLEAGLTVEARFLDQLEPPDQLRYEMLTDLPLNDEEASQLSAARRAAIAAGPHCIAHLPYWLVWGEKKEKQDTDLFRAKCASWVTSWA